MEKKKIGRPPHYDTPEKMQKKIDEYFEACEGIPYMDGEKPLLNRRGGIVYKKTPTPPTVTGLALYLGFGGRQSLIDASRTNNGHLADTIARAKSRIEQYAEERLYDRDGVRGAEFSLRCNFGWRADEAQTGKVDGLTALADLLLQSGKKRELEEYTEAEHDDGGGGTA